MAPSFEREREFLQPLISQAKGDRELERKKRTEAYYIRQLRKDCRRNIDKLYEANKGKGKFIALDRTLKELGEKRSNWKVLRDLREEAISELIDYSPTENPEYLYYSPFAIHYFSGSKVLFLGLEIDSGNAEKYLGLLYYTLQEQEEDCILTPDQWLPAQGGAQLSRAHNTSPEEKKLEPSLIIDCDITNTKFGRDYKEVKEKVEEL